MMTALVDITTARWGRRSAEAIETEREDRGPPEGMSALPGPIGLWPWQPEIADAISDPAIECVTMVKGEPLGLPLAIPFGIFHRNHA
jgi:hypothetical protein